MIDKETFIKIIDNIKVQEKIDDALGKALETVCDSYCLYGTKNKMYESLFLLLKEMFNDKDDWIGWWLYENVDKKITYKNGKSVTIKTAEQLYKFLIENMKG